jgi:8-oxo-dGTP pyrophosphatase MutT (NUDIX family)
MSQEKMVARLQPQIVTAIDLTNDKGETLLFKRSFQPYIYRLGFPLGKTHFEESVLEAAKRELEEKTGLTGITLTQRGIVYIEAKMEGITISKVLYHVLQARIKEALPTTSSHRGHCIWADAATFSAHQLMPGFIAIKKLLQNDSGFFFEEFSEELTSGPDTL